MPTLECIGFIFFVFEILTDVSGDPGGSEHMRLQSRLTEALALA